MAGKYDVIVVGAGPAGIFAALELASSQLRVLLIEKGRDLAGRQRRIASGASDRLRDHVSGFGGAGAYSDGKLTLSTEVGGRLAEYVGLERLQGLVEYVDQVYRRFGGSDQVYGEGPEVDRLRRSAAAAELRLTPVRIRHLGTERCFEVLDAMQRHLAERIELRTEMPVSRIVVQGGRVRGVELADGQQLDADHVFVAPGREGADWLRAEARRLGLKLEQNPVDLGVRVELPGAVLAGLTDVLYESKLEFFSKAFDDRVRTFCVCPWGEVITEATGGEESVITVNGHSYAGRRTENTNFALLVSTAFTEPFDEPIAYGRYVARLANILGGGVIVQRLGDLLVGRRSTPERIQRGTIRPSLPTAMPGDLSFVLPYRYLTDILEMLQAMDRLAPGVYSRHTLLYGVEVKFYSVRLGLSPALETEVASLFAGGDGAGVSRGLVQSSACGVVAAREILRRCALDVPDWPDA